MGRKPAIIIGIAAVYVALRMWGVAASCLWFDEIFGVHAAEHGWGEMFGFVAQDLIHPPLFYVVLKLWMAVGGDGVWWLRLLPVAFSVLAIFPFLQICRELKLKFLAVAVAFTLFAVNGAMIKYAQEVRMYSMLLFLSLMSVWLFTRFFVKGKSFLVLVIVNLLMVYTHYYGWLVVGVEIAAIAAFQRMKLRETLLMAGITAAGFLPWAWAVVSASRGGADVGQNIGWIERPRTGELANLFFAVADPFYFQASTAEPSTILLISVPVVVVLVAAITIYLRGGLREVPTVVYVLMTFVLLPIGLAFAASWMLPLSVWGSRHLIIVFAPALILAGMFVGELEGRQRLASVAMLSLLVASAFALWLMRPGPQYVWCEWDTVAAKAAADPSDGQVVYAFEDLTAYHLWFALRKDDALRVVKVDDVPGVAEDAAYFLPRGFDGISKVAATEPPEAGWVAFREGSEHAAVPAWVAAHGRTTEIRHEADYDGVKVRLAKLR